MINRLMISFNSFYYLNENKCTETIEFKKWFEQSKVVDENGNPLKVYKSMIPYDEEGKIITSINRQTDFPDWINKQFISKTGIKISGFFTDSSEVANRFCFSKKHCIYPVYLNIRNPYIIDAKHQPAGIFQFGETGIPFRKAILSGLYDGIIINNTSDESNVFITLKPNQVKSALCNVKFNPDNPNLNESTKSLLEAHDKKSVELYRGTTGNEKGFSKERIGNIHNKAQDVYTDNRSKTKSLFIRTWLQGNYTGIMKMLQNHTKDNANRIYGLISYTVSPYIAKMFSSNDNVNTLKLPAKHIISSRKRLKQVLDLPNDIKKKFLRDGVGFNINRLFWNISAHDTSDAESEITVFKWE